MASAPVPVECASDADDARARREAVSLRPSQPTREVSLLLLEDSALDAELIAARLVADGVPCRTAHVNTREAFAQALAKGGFDVILSDFSLPGYDGIAALRAARTACPAVPFLFVSGAIGEELAIDTLRSGATDYVLKHHLERLAPAVRRALKEADERAARRRSDARVLGLQRVSATLAAVLTAREAVEVVVAQGVEVMDALSSAAWLLSRDGAVAELVVIEDVPAARAAALRRLPLGAADDPMTDAMRTCEPVFLADAGELRARYPAHARAVATDLDDHAPAGALWCVPLVLDARALGVLAFRFAGPRAVDDGDRAMILALARQCAQAVDRARLYDNERDARERFALLARAGEALARSLEYEQTLATAAALALPMLGDFSFIDVTEPASGVRRVARAHDDPELEALLRETPWTRPSRGDVNLCALASGLSALHPALDDDFYVRAADSPEALAHMRRLAIRSLVTVPLRGRDGVDGALTLCFGRSGRRHTAADLELAEELARRVAVAVENARLYETAQRERARVEEANRLKDEFLATVSHELRTPLNAILGWSRMLREGHLAPEKRDRALATVERNARAQARLVEDLLDISRIVTGKLRLNARAIEPAGPLLAALEGVRPAAEARQITLATEVDERAGPVLGDPDRIQQVVWNLLTNAIKFTPVGGTVTVGLALAPGGVVVSVRDDGLGIAPEFLPHVFERFRQADGGITRAHGGLGLGLAIVKHLVELHGGGIEALSDGLGRGATFRVVFPRAPESLPTEPRVSHTPSQPGAAMLPWLRGVRALVVDDEVDARDLLRAILEGRGAEVATARSAQEALAWVVGERPAVVVSDIGMPGEDGYSLVQRIRALGPEAGGRTPVIALTAYARAEDRTHALDAGFDVHMAKPIDPALLLAAIVELLSLRAE